MAKGDTYNPLLDDDDLDEVFSSMTSMGAGSSPAASKKKPVRKGPSAKATPASKSKKDEVAPSVEESFDPLSDLMTDDFDDEFIRAVHRKSNAEHNDQGYSGQGLLPRDVEDTDTVTLPGDEVAFSHPLSAIDYDEPVSGSGIPVPAGRGNSSRDSEVIQRPVVSAYNGDIVDVGDDEDELVADSTGVAADDDDDSFEFDDDVDDYAVPTAVQSPNTPVQEERASRYNKDYTVSYDDDFSTDDDDDWGTGDDPDEIVAYGSGGSAAGTGTSPSLSPEVAGIVNRHLGGVDNFDDEFNDDDDDEDDDYLAGFDIDAVLSAAIEAGASDVHISPEDYVSFTVNGDIHRRMDFGMVTSRITDRLSNKVVSHVSYASLIEHFELDTAYVLKTGTHKGRRTRLSVGFSFGSSFMVFRIISDVIPTPEQLGVDPRVQRWADLPSGMVLICGPTGSGKSTTFASMIRKIQLERAQKVITVEKPIEYVYGVDGKALVTQREVGADAHSFASALTSAMRQAPDIIMVGEVRNREEVDELLRASETGHLAMSTMHTNSPPATISRIMSLYEGDEQRRILTTLKSSVRGIANQTLLKNREGNGRFSIQSVLEVNDEVSAMIGDGDVEGLNNYMRSRGTTMEHELVRAVRQGRCTVLEARSKSPFPGYFDQVLNDHK